MTSESVASLSPRSQIDVPPEKRENILHSSHLWVGNISEQVTEDQLREAFSRYGDVVSVKILRQSKCAFVNFRSIEAATNAKNNLQGTYLGGQQLSISWGQRRSRHLWVGNVGDEVSELDLHKAFEPYGEILSIRLVRETKCCFVNFRNVEDAVVARNALQRTVIAAGSSKIEINFGKRQDNLTSRHLWVGNLTDDISEDILRTLFVPFGQVLSIRLLRETNCGFVNFRLVEEAVAARNSLQGHRIGGKGQPIEIDFKFPRNHQSNGNSGMGSNNNIQNIAPPMKHIRKPADALPRRVPNHAHPLPAESPRMLPDVQQKGPMYPRFDIAAPPPPRMELDLAANCTDWSVRVKAWRYWCHLFHRAESEDAQIMYAHADDCASQPLTFVQLFIQSRALEGAIDSVMRMPPDSDADLLLCLFSYCLEGDDSVHRRLLEGLCNITHLLHQHGYSPFTCTNRSASIAKVMRMVVSAYKFDPMQVQKFAAYFSSQLEDNNRKLAETERRLQLLDSQTDMVAALLECTVMTAELLKLSKAKQQKMRTLLSRQTAFRCAKDIHLLYEDILKTTDELWPRAATASRSDSPATKDRSCSPSSNSSSSGRSPSPEIETKPVDDPADQDRDLPPPLKHVLTHVKAFVDWSKDALLEIVQKRAGQWDALMHSAQLQYLVYVERHLKQRKEQIKLFQRRLKFYREKLEAIEKERASMLEYGIQDGENDEAESTQRRYAETEAKLREVRTDMENVRFTASVFLAGNGHPDFKEIENRINELSRAVREDELAC